MGVRLCFGTTKCIGKFTYKVAIGVVVALEPGENYLLLCVGHEPACDSDAVRPVAMPEEQQNQRHSHYKQ